MNEKHSGYFFRTFFYGVLVYHIFSVIFSYLLSILLSTDYQANTAGGLGALFSILVSFAIYNASVNFPKVYASNLIKYSMIHLPDFIFETLIIFFLDSGLGWNKLSVYAVAAILVMPISFITMKILLRNNDIYYQLDFHDDSRSLIEWINEHKMLTNIGVFTLMSVLYSIANWSLLLGENRMRADIWRAEYPNQVLMTDALANHTIPMWNPLMEYGSPHYSIIGTPIWYPLTIILALIGYTPLMVSISYVMHVVLGAFGMFLLASKDAKQADGRWTVSGLCAAILGGLLYGGCGVFLANAEHIMIIISAAWVPYVFYYSRRYVEEKQWYWGGVAGLCAGLIFLGGYPEVFYDLLLYLFIFIWYLCYKRNRGIVINAVSVVFHFGSVCIFTILASAITLLPFLNNKNLITRGTGLGHVLLNNNFFILLSSIFSGMPKFILGLEPSMVNFYMGILPILSIPILIKSRHKHKRIYFMLAIMAFALCWGSLSFVHSIFYRFLPMYSTFRFPTLNRIFLILFMILLTVPVFKDIMNASVEQALIRNTRIIFYICGTTAILFALIGVFIIDDTVIDSTTCIQLSNSAFIATIFVASYLMIFSLAYKKKIKNLASILLLVVSIELLTYSFIDATVMVMSYAPTDYSNNQSVHNSIDAIWEQNANRIKEINFANHTRSTNGRESQPIVFNKTFDEEGYVSFLLTSVQAFKGTYIRSIIEQNPEVYFTNDVVTMDDISYDEWVRACDTPPEQIFADQKLTTSELPVQKLYASIISKENLELTRDGNLIILEGNLSATDQTTGRVRLYLGESQEDTLPLELVFIDDEEYKHTYKGSFCVNRSSEGDFVEIFFPDIKTSYQRLQITCSNLDVIDAAQLIVTERMTRDLYVDVSSFKFNSISMTVHAPTEGYVTILQTKHDGWTAYVDGEKQDIRLIDQCFMGIHVDAGEHVIVMRFRPKEFFVGAIITGIYYIVLLVITIKMILKME